MTFCLGIKVDEGLVGIADTRVLSGSEVILARKVSVLRPRHVSHYRASLQKKELLDVSGWWQDHLRRSVNELPSRWIESAFTESESLNGKR